jgi:PAS domain S-box-containing protein
MVFRIEYYRTTDRAPEEGAMKQEETEKEMPPGEVSRYGNPLGRIFALDPLKICLIYLVFGIIWIIFSDRIFLPLAMQPGDLVLISQVKGISFIIVTTGLLFLLIGHFTGQLLEKNDELRASYGQIAASEEAIRRNLDDLLASREALRESEERLKFALEGTNDGIWDVQMDTGIIYLSPRGRGILGYAPEEQQDQKTWSELIHPDDLPATSAALSAYIEGHSDIFSVEHRLKTRSGEWKWILTRGKAVARDDKGEPLRMVGTHTDISERKQFEHALQIANQKLNLMNIVAWHDIYNKITGLWGYVELSRKHLSDPAADTILGQEIRILKVIQQQISYTKDYQEMGQQPPRWQSFRELLKKVRMTGVAGSLPITNEVENLELFADPLIEKVFWHLIDNSVKHGEHATEIRISGHDTQSGYLLVYQDNGVGIPEEKKEELFTKNFGKMTGFHLFFVHDILDISDMKIDETGTPGKGVRFEISIPRGLYRFILP